MTTRPTFVRVGWRAINLNQVISLRYDPANNHIVVFLAGDTALDFRDEECVELLDALRRLEVVSWPDAP